MIDMEQPFVVAGPVVVAGNGVSVTSLDPGRILADDFFIRTNNFFFEPEYYLGRRVDLAFMAGDPRVAPFMFETLHRCRKDYDLRAWTSQNPKTIRAGLRRFSGLFQPMRYRDQAIEAEVAKLVKQYDRQPTTGINAVLMAHALGAGQIILAGLDFYTSTARYPYQPGRHYRDLMGQDLGQRGLDQRLHSTDLDLAILRALTHRQDCELLRAADNPVLNDLMDQAPVRAGQILSVEHRTAPPKDWVGRVGGYPITALKVLRKGSALKRQIMGRLK